MEELLMNDFWHEEEGTECDEKLHKDENTIKSKKGEHLRLILVIGFGLVTVLALVLGLAFGLRPR